MNNFAFKRKLQQQKFAEQSIKPIETQYKGYRFRSRLEARWAVFFDTLGVQWEYEPQGYKLPGVGWYLPDFYLPQAQFYAEVKPSWEAMSDRERAKLDCFDKNAPPETFGLLYLIGAPDPDAQYGPQGEVPCTLHVAGRCDVHDINMIRSAAIAARSARFEHGENGERGL